MLALVDLIYATGEFLIAARVSATP